MIDWQTPPQALKLNPGLVHVWRISLDRSAELFTPFLSPDEQARADRFHQSVHQERFIIARGMLRQIIGQYLKQPPSSLIFSYGDHGKPMIANLEFNLSHTSNLALLAISIDRPVGIDLEQIRPMENLTKLAARFFTAEEHQTIMAADAAKRTELFFRTWTGKEAYLKAIGVGLGGLQQSIIRPDWDVREIIPADGFVGAIAAPGKDWEVRFYAG
jgi:4'-phosphopantetheinyl transferase